MTLTKKRRKKPQEEHTYLAICVEHYEASVETAVNHKVYGPEYAWNLDDNDPLYRIETQLTITGTSTYLTARAGDIYELIIDADGAPSPELNATLKDAQARDTYGAWQYRAYRGRQIPVYNAPSGMGVLRKVRGEPRWTAWLLVAPRFVNDALVLLSHGKDLFLAIHERKKDRTRWIRSLSLQTTDPEKE